MKPPKNREIVASKLFDEQARKLGNFRRLDEVLRGVEWALSTRPEEFPAIHNEIRLVATDSYGTGKLHVPRLRIWFRILGESRVELLYVESAEDDLLN